MSERGDEREGGRVRVKGVMVEREGVMSESERGDRDRGLMIERETKRDNE